MQSAPQPLQSAGAPNTQLPGTTTLAPAQGPTATNVAGAPGVQPQQTILPSAPQMPAATPSPAPATTTQSMTLQQQQAQFQQQQQQMQLQQQQMQQPQHAQQQINRPNGTTQQPLQAQPQSIPQQQHFPHQGLNGGWQSDKDVQERRKMIAKIVHLLQQRKPNAPQEWLKKLPQMAKRLEESLYRSAKSFGEYNDASTLKQRLQQLAVNIGMKTKKMQQAQLAQQQKQQQYQAQQQQQQQQQQYQAQQQYQPQQPQQQQPLKPQPQQQVQPQHVAASPAVNMQPMQQTQQVPLQQPQIQAQAPSQAPQRQIVNMSDINPIMGGTAQQASGSVQQVAAPGTSGTTAQNVQSVSYQQPIGNQQAGTPAPAAPSAVVGASQTTSSQTTSDQNGSRTSGSSRHVSDRQQVLRHQQQRLLLLRHAAKCQHEDGRCPVTPHCAGMKRLWKHIAECKDQKCLVPHCVSSRYVLSHYHRCKDVRCPVCGPVREAIHRSHEKQKQMQALKQRHQQAVQQTQLSSADSSQQQRGAMVTGQPPASGALTQPLQPGAATQPVSVAQSATSTELPPSKRRKPNSAPASGQVPSYQQGVQHPGILQTQKQPLAQSSSHLVGPKGSAIPPQPVNPNVKAGYVYSHPQAAAPVGGSGSVRPGVPSAVPGIAYSNGQVIMPKHSGPKPQEDHTLINCFTIEQIETHIASLNKGLQLAPLKLKTKCLDVLKVLQSHQHGWVFNSPVDPVELGLHDYFEVIKRPMDLGTIKKRLENGCYHSIDEFEEHVHLTFDNAMLYNPEGSVVHNMAKEMKAKFVVDYEQLIRQLNAEEDEKRKNGEACLLCGCEKLLFEPPVFYCNGQNCPSKRIRRNSYYYVGGNNQYHWCHQCFGELQDGHTFDFGDVTFKKESLTKKKNDEVHEESWVQCDKCERWIHQICALFNTRQNKDQRSEYTCPRCTIEERKKKGVQDGTSTTPMAEDLPRTKLSERLESHVREKVDAYFERMAIEKAASENIPLEEAKKGLHMGGPITIRQVTSMDRKLEVRDRMKRRYAFKNYPEEFTFRCKCVVVFQNLDGVDVVLFGLYVYEHDEKNPAPNTRAVYISYLDSVHYMRPRSMRTFIYHEILIAYLDYVREKGFATAHIWACPPLKGDDYILYAKPEDQKTPKDDRLRQWYIDMLVECQKRGIVGRVTNMYDLYFANESNDATIVPYMDGDYFPAEAENIIKDLEEGKSGKKSSAAGKKKKGGNKAKNKQKKSGRGGTRSTGIDEEALAASGIIPPGVETKSLQDGGRDFVMAKLGETIQPMKESFIVAFLNWSGAKEEDLVVPKEIQEYREKHGICAEESDAIKKNKEDGTSPNTNPTEETKQDAPSSAAAGPATKNDGGTDSKIDAAENETEDKDISDTSPENAPTSATAQQPEDSKTMDASTSDQTTPANEGTPPADPAANAAGAPPPAMQDEAEKGEATNSNKVSPTNGSAAAGPQNAVTVRDGKFAAMAARKRNSDGKVKEESTEKPAETSSSRLTVKDSKGRLVKVIDDDLEEMDCEFLNNRQAFLNLCQGNHYQFDQLRRAKHSSMMVLWHLHNRDAPKFVQQCAICSREILTGYRYHCPTCADYDQCHDCVSNPNSPRHPHPLKPVAVASGQQSELTEAQRKERQRSIQLHMTLLLHAATCVSPKCPSANCTKMKGLLKHGAQCQIKANGGCHVCKRIWALLQLHARQCKASTCPVPNCMAIRERFRQLKKQQQAMDDRRRQEMNRHYRGGR